MWNMVFLFTGLIFIITLVLTFASKQRIKSKENRMFRILSIVNIVGFIIEISMQLMIRKLGVDYLLVIPIAKLYIIFIFVWFTIFSIYTFLISFNEEEDLDKKYSYKLIKYIHITIAIIGTIAIAIMPISIYYSNGEMYSYGMATTFLKIMLGIYVFIWIVRLFINFKTIIEKKYYPVIVTILLLFTNIIVQSANPTILIATFTMTYTCYILFFTIENPDIRLIKELTYSKSMAEKWQTGTLEILNEMQNELKGSLVNLVNFGFKKIDKDDTEEVNKEIKYIQKYSVKLADKVSGIIDLAKINSGQYDLKNGKYDTYEMIENLKYLYMLEKGNRKISITTEISDNLHKVLYGDSEKVKQVSLYLLSYIISLIKTGDIHISVDSMNVGNFSRLKFHYFVNYDSIKSYLTEINDFSGGKSYSTLDKRFFLDGYKSNTEYLILNKLLDILKAKIDVRIDDNNMVEILLLINQRIMSEYEIVEQKEENKDIKVKYFKVPEKRILIVDDNKAMLKNLILLFRPYACDVNVAMNEEQMNQELSTNTPYDLIIMDDIIPSFNIEDEYMEPIDIRKKVKKTAGYNIPIVIMVTENRAKLESKYKKIGFDDCITKPMNKAKINEIALKYLAMLKENNIKK
jgi:CheY-like chemotaxis protein/signal transduction histidine kinase